jgi:hypothetical protein
MPGRDDPEHFPTGIFSILHDEGDQLPTDKTDETVLCGVVAALIFNIGQRKHLLQAGKVNMAPLEDLLSFGFIPSETQRESVYFLYRFATAQQRHGVKCA